ncbi:MAG TPA: hypothetical protein VLX59_15320, partial [Acidimicrobiales bacterium]|nr:hypothetical protein [Acidimicrobiales bacterium]
SDEPQDDNLLGAQVSEHQPECSCTYLLEGTAATIGSTSPLGARGAQGAQRRLQLRHIATEQSGPGCRHYRSSDGHSQRDEPKGAH